MPERWTEMHPGRDPDLLERYTLGQIPAPERSAIDAHFRDCAECRQLLEEELRLAAGVRHMARAQLKERLAGRVAHTVAIPWPRIAAAAAILLVAGVSVIGLWLRPWEKETPPAAKETTSGETYAAGQDKGRSRTEAPPLPSAEKKSGKREEHALKERDELQAIDASKAPEKLTTTAASEVAGAEAAEGVWTEGIVSEEPAEAVGDLRKDGREKRAPSALEMQTNAPRKSAAPPAVQEQEVILNQQPSRLLQNRQQMLQQAANSIPTLARQVGNQLNLTLYPDSLFPEGELRQATVSRPVDDSLVIRVGNQQIRYRLPSSLLQQKNAR